MAKEANSVIMEISDEEGEQIGGGKRNYGRGDATRCSKQSTRKFHGNQFTPSKVSKTTTPASHKKSKKCSKTFYKEKTRWLQACRYGHIQYYYKLFSMP